MNREEILIFLKEMIDIEPSITCEECWNRINKISKKECESFEKEKKSLIMSDEYFNRCFTI